jgi:hypothetical protein
MEMDTLECVIGFDWKGRKKLPMKKTVAGQTGRPLFGLLHVKTNPAGMVLLAGFVF